MYAQMTAWMYARTNTWIYGRMDGCNDGWMGRYINPSIHHLWGKGIHSHPTANPSCIAWLTGRVSILVSATAFTATIVAADGHTTKLFLRKHPEPRLWVRRRRMPSRLCIAANVAVAICCAVANRIGRTLFTFEVVVVVVWGVLRNEMTYLTNTCACVLYVWLHMFACTHVCMCVLLTVVNRSEITSNRTICKGRALTAGCFAFKVLVPTTFVTAPTMFWDIFLAVERCIQIGVVDSLNPLLTVLALGSPSLLIHSDSAGLA